MNQWQERWEANENGNAEWTRRLIIDLRAWLSRKHGEVTYSMTQILSGHGCFGYYLHRMALRDSAACMYGDSASDTAEHTLLKCKRWQQQRSELVQCLGVDGLTPQNIIPAMLSSEKEWNAVSGFVEAIMRTKEREAKLKQ